MLEDFLATLDPKIARQVRTAQQTELIKYPYASLGLTHATGGGFGASRVTLVYGNPSSGKSLLMMETIALLQRTLGLNCAYFDVEGTYDKSWAARLGVDNSELILEQPKSFGKITDKAVPLLDAGIDVLVIDTNSDALPEVFVDKDGHINDFKDLKQMAAHAKSNTIMLNALHYANKRTAIVVLSQTTTMIANTYVKQIPHGGQKMLFGSSQIVHITSSPTDDNQIKGKVTVGDRVTEIPIGRTVQAKVEKNKVGAPGGKAEYEIYYAGDHVGIDPVSEVYELSVELGVIEKPNNTTHKFEGVSWNGKPATKQALREDDGLFQRVKKELNTRMTGEV